MSAYSSEVYGSQYGCQAVWSLITRCWVCHSFSLECLSKMHYMQCTQWTLCSSSAAATGKLISSSGSRQHNETSQHFPPANCLWFHSKPVFKYPSRLLAKLQPPSTSHSIKTALLGKLGRELPVWSSGIQPHLCNEKTCGTVSKTFFLLVRLGIIFCLTKLMWGSIHGVSNRMGGPTDEQRIIAISGCDSI